MDDYNGQDDEIAIDPVALPGIPIFLAVSTIAGRLRRQLLVEGKRRPTGRGWLLAAIAAVTVIAALKLAGLIWTSTPPRWVPALGPGVTVTGPRQAAPGHGSPGAVLAGVFASLSAHVPAMICDYEYGSVAQCEQLYRGVSRSQLADVVSVRIGYVATDGTRALVGFTGKVCFPSAPSQCIANRDPAAIFSSGSTFAALWAQTTGPSSSGGYGLLPCIEVGGKWYLGTTGPGQSAS
jgi:hypothetical protein